MGATVETVSDEQIKGAENTSSAAVPWSVHPGAPQEMVVAFDS